MKRSEITFAILQVILDFFALLLAAWLAYSIRFSGFFIAWRPAVSIISWHKYFYLSFSFSFIWLIIFALAGLYPIGKPKKFLSEFGRLISAASVGFVLVTVVMFLARDVISSRFVVLAAWALAITLVAAARLFIRLIRKLVFIFGIGTHRIALISDEITKNLISPFLSSRASGYKLVNFYALFDELAAQEIAELQKEDKIDEVFLIKPQALQDELVRAKEFSHTHHLAFSYAADPFLISHRNLEFSTLAGIPIVELKRSRLDGWGRVFKRVADTMAAIILLILLSPVLVILSLLVKITSSGPVIFRNERIGEDGKVFDALKFRTMRKEYSIGKQFANQAEAARFEEKLIREHGIKQGPIYKIANDPRLTPLGRFMRRLSLDELPQLWNVVRGEMSLVGPRPHQAREVEHYALSARKVLNIRPGLTGLAQISGRSDLSHDEEVRLDTYYIENWSPWLDLYILLKTPFVVISKTGAY